MSILPGALSQVGVDLERQAYGAFGAAVDAFADQTLKSVTGGNDVTLTGDPVNAIREFSGTWSPTNYAKDLIDVAPKHRFMFKVLFRFSPPFQKLNPPLTPNLAKTEDNIFTFMVKQIDRPSITFEYEDVNFYNFNSKVLKKVSHEPLSMVFYDDIKNYVIDFFNKYRLSYSPIGRLNSQPSIPGMEVNGMNFNSGNYSSSVGPLQQGAGEEVFNVLENITVRQIFAHGTQAVDFVFVNPRILAFDFDEVDHETGQSNGLTVRFDYDALYLRSPPFQEFKEPQRRASRDILNSGNMRNTGSLGPDMNSGGLINSVLNSVVSVGGRVAGSAVSGVVNKVLGPKIGGAVGYTLNSFTRSATSNTLRNASSGIQQSTAKTATTVTDNTTTENKVKSTIPVLYV